MTNDKIMVMGKIYIVAAYFSIVIYYCSNCDFQGYSTKLYSSSRNQRHSNGCTRVLFLFDDWCNCWMDSL